MMIRQFFRRKSWKQIAVTYAVAFILFSGLYLFLFHTPLFSFQQVLFYRGLWLLSTTVLFSVAVILLLAHNEKGFKPYLESVISAVIVSVSINLVIFTLLPVTFDRSVSTYLLSTLDSTTAPNCSGLTKQQLEKTLIDQYIVKNNALQKRIIEQTEIGFIKSSGECISLTDRARNFLQLKRAVEKMYDLR